VKLWDAASGKETDTLQGHTEAVHSVCFSPDGRRLASASEDETVKLLEGGPGPETLGLRGEMLSLSGSIERVKRVGFSADGQRLIAQGETTVNVWDITTGLAVEGASDPPPRAGQRLAQSPDGAITAWINGPRVQVQRIREWEEGRRREAELDLAWHLRQAAESEESSDWFAAAFHFDQLLRADPKNATYHDRRGSTLAQRGRWEEAAGEFDLAARLATNNAWFLHRWAWALLGGGDPKGYRQGCDRLSQDFDDKTDASSAAAIAYTGALSAASGIDPQRLVERARVAVKSDPQSADYLETLGAALYRSRDDKAAIESLEKAVGQHVGVTAWMQLFLAMAHHRLGHAAEARRWLAEYDRQGWKDRSVGMLGASFSGPLPAVTWLAVPTAEWPYASDNWEFRLIGRLLRREAEAVLREKPDPNP
jgi:Tfp pilus assembly protein PilF